MFMEVLLVIYIVCASALLISCASGCSFSKQHSLVPNLKYILISATLLDEWRRYCTNLVIIDTRAKINGREPGETLSDTLNISIGELHHLLNWMPPGARLVFFREPDTDPFDIQLQARILDLGIGCIYFVGDCIDSSLAFVKLNVRRWCPVTGSRR
jgi:hypothetical protein